VGWPTLPEQVPDPQLTEDQVVGKNVESNVRRPAVARPTAGSKTRYRAASG
jgi:hypothetical protein